MRIVIDMQGAQSSGSWNRGIGRYTISLALAMVRNRGGHEIFIALNGAFPASIERIRAKFEGILPQKNIRVWYAHPSMAYIDSGSEWRRKSGELVREAFLANLNPDFVVVSSLFEGLVDDAVTSLKCFSDKYLTAVILYDLIPFIYRQPYLANPVVEAWYLEKIEYLRRADLWLAISESSNQEGVEHLALPLGRCINISTDADDQFQRITVSRETERHLRTQYGLTRNFVMYTGGIDHRKNIEGLIRAYAKLSLQLRATHQLAIVCSVQEDSRLRLLALATSEGMNADDVILTGFVPEEDLIALYNLCAVFVFPSWHEGFGLPALEAMRCGAPVIAANVSSLPEVVGLADALFDPHSDGAISHAIGRVLTDAVFREHLIAHGRMQATKFSWDETARRAITAMQRVVDEPKAPRSPAERCRPKMAYVSPLPSERSGISDYSAELLPVLAQHYEIDVVVAQESVTDLWVNANCPIRSVQWFVANADRFDRVLYHFGNSVFHQHMFGLLDTVPGVVVLHDFYLSGVIHHMEALGYAPGCFTAQLYHSHGYAGLFDRTQSQDVADVIWKYPCSREVIEKSIGTIVHSESSVRLVQRWYGEKAKNCSVTPLLRSPALGNKNESARKELGFSDRDFIVCSFGMMGPSKLNHRLVQAWLDSNLSKSGNCHLVFVGENNPTEYGGDLLKKIKRHPNGTSIRITGWVEQETFRSYLFAADLGVQLRTLSRGETSAAVLDCMNYGLATIVNANGSMADLADDAVWKLSDEFSDEALVQALETLWRDGEWRQQIGAKARSTIINDHDPDQCAEQYKTAIESFYSKNSPILKKLLGSIASISTEPLINSELIGLATSIATNFPPVRAARQLLVDISELVQRDAISGIQRIVRSVLRHWLLNPPVGWRVEPIYATAVTPYRYARQFTTAFLGIPSTEFEDDLVDFAPDDTFFALDFQPHVQSAKADFYQHLRQQGVAVKFMVYDLLCITQPDNFYQGTVDDFKNWLQVVGECDGVVCISKTDADELLEWMGTKSWKRLRPFEIDSTPLAADVDSTTHTRGLPSDAETVLTTLRRRTSFLIVDTLEPRSVHAEVIDAFGRLWKSGSDINLVIVGRQGRMAERLSERLRTHLEFGERLFWLESINDDYLEKLYTTCTCLITGSYGEGFGLPIFEAAQHNLPIIARDNPIFREVAGERAHYFNETTPDALAGSLLTWIKQHETQRHSNPEGVNWLTLEDNAVQLLGKILLSRCTA